MTVFRVNLIYYSGGVITTFIFPYGLRVNREAYIKCLEEVVLPWFERVATRRPYVWQQESVPRHTSRWIHSQQWDNFCHHITPNIWPPCSLDHNPLYYVWGTVELETNKTLCDTKEELKAKITTGFTHLDVETVGKICRRFLSRLVETNDKFLE